MPDETPLQRLTSALRKFGILAREGETPSQEQITFQKAFDKRVAMFKGWLIEFDFELKF